MGNSEILVEGKHYACPQKKTLDYYYRKKLYELNIKTIKEFRAEIISIGKRTQVFKYNWAKLLCVEFGNMTASQLYEDYKQILKENCSNDGKQQAIFCPTSVRELFINDFQFKYSQCSEEQDDSLLDQAFEQSKVYMMVMTWLWKLVSVVDSIYGDESNIFKMREDQLRLQERMFSTLMKLVIQKLHSSYSKNNEVKTIENTQQIQLIKMLNHRSSLRQKQKVISFILNKYSRDEKKLKEIVESMIVFFGYSRVSAYILTIKQLGNLCVDCLWELIKNK